MRIYFVVLLLLLPGAAFGEAKDWKVNQTKVEGPPLKVRVEFEHVSKPGVIVDFLLLDVVGELDQPRINEQASRYIFEKLEPARVAFDKLVDGPVTITDPKPPDPPPAVDKDREAFLAAQEELNQLQIAERKGTKRKDS